MNSIWRRRSREVGIEADDESPGDLDSRLLYFPDAFMISARWCSVLPVSERTPEQGLYPMNVVVNPASHKVKQFVVRGKVYAGLAL
jgi:hypothetical protein